MEEKMALPAFEMQDISTRAPHTPCLSSDAVFHKMHSLLVLEFLVHVRERECVNACVLVCWGLKLLVVGFVCVCVFECGFANWSVKSMAQTLRAKNLPFPDKDKTKQQQQKNKTLLRSDHVQRRRHTCELIGI